MLTLRRRLASWALALLFCQAIAVFGAPLSSCCARTQAAAAEDHDCCPAGSHPPGQCPRHAAAATKTSCRLQCDAPHGVQFLITALGVMPPPAHAAFAALTPGQFLSIAQPATTARVDIPPSPPPRLA
jgi:hypothetical protein